MIQPSLRPQLSLLAKTPKCDLSMWFELLLSMMARFQKQALSESYRYISKERQKRGREKESECQWVTYHLLWPSLISLIALLPQHPIHWAAESDPVTRGEATYSNPWWRTQAFLEENWGWEVTLWPSLENTSHHVILPCISLIPQWGFHDSCDFLFVQ